MAAAGLGARGRRFFFSQPPGLACGSSRRAPCGSLALSCSRSPRSARWRRWSGCAGRPDATSRLGSTATPGQAIARRPRSPTVSPMITAIPAPAPSGPRIRRGLPARSRRSASPPPRRAWPSAIRTRCRFGVALLAFAAAVTAGPELYGRFAAAFDWRGGDAAAAAAASRIDAWIDPPPYAGRPPVVIDFKTADAAETDGSRGFDLGRPRPAGRRRDPRRGRDHGGRTRRTERRPRGRPSGAGQSMATARRRSCAAGREPPRSRSPSLQRERRRSS